MTPPTESEDSINSIFANALPQVIAAGLFAIAVLLVNIQVQQATTQADVRQMMKSIEELKNDSKTRLDDLDRRVRNLEIRR